MGSDVEKIQERADVFKQFVGDAIGQIPYVVVEIDEDENKVKFWFSLEEGDQKQFGVMVSVKADSIGRLSDEFIRDRLVPGVTANILAKRARG